VSPSADVIISDYFYPIDHKKLAANILTRGASKENDGTSEVLGVSPAASRNALSNLTIAHGVLE
jgi:hypothetical protein